MTLRVACEHGKWETHYVLIPCPDDHDAWTFDGMRIQMSCTVAHYLQCPGWREPTVEEITQWLNDRHYNVVRAVSLEGRNQ